MKKRTRVDIAAMALGYDRQEMNDCRYQAGWTTPVPIWSAGDGYIAVASAAEAVKLNAWMAGRSDVTQWVPHRDAFVQKIAGEMNPPRCVYVTQES
jgi:hypothetical protein